MKHSKVYVSPKISEEEAREILCRKSRFLRSRIGGGDCQPLKVELIYLPFHLFELALSNHRGDRMVTVAMDGVLGHMIFLMKDDLEYESGNGQQICNFVLKSDDAREEAIDQYRWSLLEHDLRNKRMITVQEIVSQKQIFYPFWIGYILKKKGYDFRACDGISGEIQGIKMRKVFLGAFREMHST
jgi:hypothetical protein